ncbi:tRNA epoxyqueuosine(34) reductase QueG [Halanaerobium praevalens]|uniref:DUF1730 domain-containing protein n=1 Tax=Halanaerobium praevalens (strain ATCC 33744 / DSM 2228 / GSL) TaxID=572479 RepID=E3DQX8_HALPG|nr:tRNA epoxyqueuosine(34) reductase QueG [Halanaerobium praevalens]ADO76953.1 domain of unknown function DUF1730 [Halanaerobium praevalens DSM 2228]
MQLNSLVKKSAANLKIDICQITDGNDLVEARKILEQRVKSEYWPQPLTNQNLDELTKPRLQLDNLNSIIVAAISYNNQGGNQYLSNYVTVLDYHNYLENKLEELVNNLKNKIDKDFNYKIFVDTAPFLEREVARKAGVGFIGKNTMLINPNFGSYLFLGEILTDLKIKKDQPLINTCANCKICLENCEGDALKKDYLLAADDCISYLTQKKSLLTEENIKKINNHLWGCDACQEKCPYNKNILTTNNKNLNFFNKNLSYFLNLKRKKIPAELEKTAIVWRGNRILLRNALIVAANLKKEQYFDLIIDKLDDNSPIIRYYAAYALAKINFKRAKKIIKKQLIKEKDQFYQKKITEILEQEAENEA